MLWSRYESTIRKRILRCVCVRVCVRAWWWARELSWAYHEYKHRKHEWVELLHVSTTFWDMLERTANLTCHIVVSPTSLVPVHMDMGMHTCMHICVYVFPQPYRLNNYEGANVRMSKGLELLVYRHLRPRCFKSDCNKPTHGFHVHMYTRLHHHTWPLAARSVAPDWPSPTRCLHHRFPTCKCGVKIMPSV